MAAKKTGTARKTTQKKKPANKAAQTKNAADDKVLWSTVIFAAALLFTAFAVIDGESVWLFIHNMLLGLFGVTAVFVPVILLYAAVMIACDKKDDDATGKIAQGFILILVACAMVQIFFSDPPDEGDTLGRIITVLYSEGKTFHGGGLMAIVLGIPLIKLFGVTGAKIIILLIMFICIMLIANKTVVDIFRFIKKIFIAANNARPEYRDDYNDDYENDDGFVPPPGARKAQQSKKQAKRDVPDRSKVPNSDVPESVMEETRKSFEIDIPIPGSTQDSAGKVRGKGKKAENSDYYNEEKPRSQTDMDAEEIGRQIDKNEAERKAVRFAAERDNHQDDWDNHQDDYQDNYNVSTTDNKEQGTDNEELASIIKKAAAAKKAQENHEQQEEPAAQSVFPASLGGVKKAKGSTLASNKISDDEDLDMPETTAKDIQNEIAGNIPAPVEYIFPPIDLLRRSSNDMNAQEAEEEMKQNADTLVETLKSFGVMTRIVDIHRGPTVTRYELQPNAGVKISRITGLADDIALNLAAEGVRIQAPIPGKAAVGIEVPNKVKDIVTLRDVLDTEEFRNAQSKLTFAVGKNIDGEIILGDVAKLPHVIIAGTTGSGKSVCTNGIIMSILYNASPDEVRLVLIDPKVVEFKIYDGIPHLLIPVVTDPRKAAGALAWAVQEMLKRYKLFADNNVRDLKGYNEMAEETEGIEPLPRIVIVIDELADLMMAAAGEVEDSICRLAQMARAAGMHLIVATQRPTVDVITGLIKANIPSRIALKVASGIDSRSIINEIGAEKLLGNGDLLYFPTGSARPMRVQNCFASDKEVAAVVNFIKNGAGDVTYSDDIMKEIESNIPQAKNEKAVDNGKSYEGSDEDITERAIECAVDAGSAGVSVSYFQRKLKLGYARAARIMDDLEEMGVVGPQDNNSKAKPRQVLMSREMYLQRKLSEKGGE